MESLSYAFEGRALLFTDDTDFPVDGFVRNRNLSKKWDGDDPVESMGFIEPLLPDTTRKSFLSNQCLEICGDDANDHSGKSVQSASTITLNSLVDRFSGCVDRDNDEKFAAQRECNENMFSVDNSVFSSPEPSVSAKRAKVTNLQSQIPTCQVHGCNKDLSSSKDYHKRHKVCDVHSKTAVVIVNGIQQRFCQQCSRFHVLAEFDEGKRSCRKRLAGHNERRRKPQFETHLGSSYFTTDASKTSLIFSRILPGGFFNLQRNEPNNHNRHLTLEEEPNQISQLDERFDQSHPKSVLHFHGVGKQYPSKNCLNAPLSLPVFSVGSDSGCALSLLSAQSQSLLNNSAGISTAHSLTSKENRHANLFTFQNSATPLGEIPENLTPFVSDSSAVEQERLHLVPNSRVAADSEIRQNQEPNTLKLKRYLSPEGANTVDLLELSLHLQRVEQQKYYGHVKLENGIFCDSTIT